MKASVTILPAQHFYHYCKPLKIVEAAKAKPLDESYLVVVVDLYSYKDNNQCNLLLLSSSSSPHSSSSSSLSQYICAHKASPFLDSCTSTRNTSFIDLPTNLDTSPSLHQITRLESPLLLLYSSTKRSNKVERFFSSIIALQYSRKRFSKSLSSHQISLPLPPSSPSSSSSLIPSTYCLYKGKSDSIEIDKSANLLLACYSLLHSLEPHPSSTTSYYYYYHYCNYFTLKYIIDCYTLLPLYLLVFQFNFICNICFNFIVKLNPNNQIKLAWSKVNFIEINSKPCYRTYLISQI